jgi:hypothetical protein
MNEGTWAQVLEWEQLHTAAGTVSVWVELDKICLFTVPWCQIWSFHLVYTDWSFCE